MVEEKQEGGVFCPPPPPGKIGLRKQSFYCRRPMTFRFVSFHCKKEACQQLSEVEQLFSIDFSEVEKLLCVI